MPHIQKFVLVVQLQVKLPFFVLLLALCRVSTFGLVVFLFIFLVFMLQCLLLSLVSRLSF